MNLGAVADCEVRVRSDDPSDARARLVTLSDKGTYACGLAGAEIDRVEDEWRKHLGHKAFAQLRAALISLRAITDPYR